MNQAIFFGIVLAVGAWFSWKDISRGSGWICGHFSTETLQSLNCPEGRVKKFLLAIVLGYITIAFTFLKWLITLAIRLTDGL